MFKLDFGATLANHFVLVRSYKPYAGRHHIHHPLQMFVFTENVGQRPFSQSTILSRAFFLHFITRVAIRAIPEPVFRAVLAGVAVAALTLVFHATAFFGKMFSRIAAHAVPGGVEFEELAALRAAVEPVSRAFGADGWDTVSAFALFYFAFVVSGRPAFAGVAGVWVG